MISSQSVSRSHKEAGAVLLIVGLLLAIILAFAAYLFFEGSQNLVRSQLQNAADAAAVAGAAALCGSEACWTAARAETLAVLSEHPLYGNKQAFDLSVCTAPDTCPSIGAPDTEWNFESSRELIVTIERGRWLPNYDEAYYYNADKGSEYLFESMEGDWAADHPGIPVALAANALRVTLLRKNVRSALPVNIFGSDALKRDIEVASVAVGVQTSKVCVAPFALPACALLNDSDGSFSSENLCSGDRIFTQSDRYCADGGDCGVYPSFEYGPCHPAHQATDRHRNGRTTPPYPTGAMYGSLPATGALLHFYESESRPASFMGMPNQYYEANFGISEPYRVSSAGYGCASYLKPNLDAHEYNNPLGEIAQMNIYTNQSVTRPWVPYSFDNYYAPFYANQWGPTDVHGSGSVADHFGVVGLPIANTMMNGISVHPLSDFEEDKQRQHIQQVLANSAIDFADPNAPGTQGCFTAEIGQLFQVLKNGARKPGEDTLMEQALWSRITGFNGGGASATHPAAIDTNIGTLEAQTIFGMLNAHTPMRGHGLCRSKRMKMALTGPSNINVMDSAPLTTHPQEGLRRVDLDWGAGITVPDVVPTEKWTALTGPPGWHLLRPQYSYRNLADDGSWKWNFKQSPLTLEGRSFGFAVVPQSGVSDQTSVWKVKVPVIADPSGDATACGAAPSELDPQINAKTAYQIIGFVDINFYDVDMAPLPNTTPSLNHGPLPQDDLIIPGNAAPGFDPPLCTQYGGCDYDYTLEELNEFRRDVYGASGYTQSIVNPDYVNIPSAPDGSYWGPRPWFFEVEGEPTECNLARARVACDISIVSGSVNNEERTPRLVD